MDLRLGIAPCCDAINKVYGTLLCSKWRRTVYRWQQNQGLADPQGAWRKASKRKGVPYTVTGSDRGKGDKKQPIIRKASEEELWFGMLRAQDCAFKKQ